MKKFKNLIHIMLAASSIFAFLTGWVTFAHSLKPNQPINDTNAAIEPLPALASIGSGLGAADQNNGGLNVFTPSNPGRRTRSFFMTGGS